MLYDVLIIGNGIAGLTSAINIKSKNGKVAVISKTYPTQSQSCMAQGGINASLNKEDIVNHISDTLKSSIQLGNKDNIKFMCEEAPKTIEWLNSIGVPFSRDKDKIAQRKLGGASEKRACYAKDYTGLKILHTLFDKSLSENIEFFNEYFLLNLIIEDNQVIGVTALDIETSEVKEFFLKVLF